MLVFDVPIPISPSCPELKPRTGRRQSKVPGRESFAPFHHCETTPFLLTPQPTGRRPELAQGRACGFIRLVRHSDIPLARYGSRRTKDLGRPQNLWVKRLVRRRIDERRDACWGDLRSGSANGGPPRITSPPHRPRLLEGRCDGEANGASRHFDRWDSGPAGSTGSETTRRNAF